MKKSGSILLGILFGILCLLLATALALGLIHITGLPYYIDINALNIPESSGYSRDVIVSNYDAVMKFLSPFYNGPFDLPDLAYSEGGAQHFVDCKVIFNAVYAAGAVSMVLVILILILKKKKDKRFLLASGITTLALPVLLLGLIAVDFDRMFVLFHKIFFSNDLWIFNPRYDEVINILPAAFFMHCAIIIAVFWVVAAIIQFVFYRRNNQKTPV